MKTDDLISSRDMSVQEPRTAADAYRTHAATKMDATLIEAVQAAVSTTHRGDRHIPVQPFLSADEVQANIDAALKRIATTVPHTISVHAARGQVTLTGTVHSWLEREMAMYTAWNTLGVRNVIDQIVVLY